MGDRFIAEEALAGSNPNWLSDTMAATFTAILTAHLLGDFIFQTRRMIERKRQIRILLLHVLLVTSASGIILCVPAGGILIAKLIGRFTDEIRTNDIAGLTQGSQYIGWPC